MMQKEVFEGVYRKSVAVIQKLEPDSFLILLQLPFESPFESSREDKFYRKRFKSMLNSRRSLITSEWDTPLIL